jgi:hypothetical protein
MILIAIIAVWLGIVGPMPQGFSAWLHNWQTLAAAGVASVAAYVAFQNTTRSLAHSERLEMNRRTRKHAAIRAILPLSLSRVQQHAEESARELHLMLAKCVDESFPAMTAPNRIGEPLPAETLQVLADFIEYADTTDVTVLEATVAWIQIHDSRLRGMVRDNRDPEQSHVIVRHEIESRIIDAATIYAGAAAFYDYARRRTSSPPVILSWDDVTSALRNMRFWADEQPRLHQIVAMSAASTAGPFDRLNTGNG